MNKQEAWKTMKEGNLVSVRDSDVRFDYFTVRNNKIYGIYSTDFTLYELSRGQLGSLAKADDWYEIDSSNTENEEDLYLSVISFAYDLVHDIVGHRPDKETFLFVKPHLEQQIAGYIEELSRKYDCMPRVKFNKLKKNIPVTTTKGEQPLFVGSYVDN